MRDSWSVSLLAETVGVTRTAEKFVLFGGVHLLILFSTLAVPFALSRLTRREERPRLARVLALILASVLLLDRIAVLFWAFHVGKIAYWANALPMHLCDWALCFVIVALVRRAQLPYELAYLWGLSGTFQAILTPDVSENFPNPFFISFFISHCGIIVSVLFLTWGLGMRPLPGAVWRVFLWSQVYLLSAGLVNWIFRAHHVNFGYLAFKPSDVDPTHGSLLDYFGRWPWYILTLEAMSLVFFMVFYLPFWIADRRRASRLPADTEPVNAS